MLNFNKKIQQILEDVTTSNALGPTQSHPAQVGKSSDFYAPGDSRVPPHLYSGKKKKKKVKETIIRRTPPIM